MATPVVGPAAAPDAGQLHPALNVFLAPGETMRSLARRPRFLVALLIASVIGTVITSLALQRGVIEQFMRHKMESNPRMEQLPADQRDRIIEQSLKFSSYGYVAVAVVGPTVGLLLVSGVFLLLTKVVGGKSASYRQMMAVVAHGWLPHSLANLVAIPILLAKDPESVDFQNMLPMANLSVLFSPTEQHKQYLLGSSIDLFSFWVIWLFAIGLSELTGKSKAAVLPVILVPWALFVCFKVVTG
jgi:hypothetical protein